MSGGLVGLKHGELTEMIIGVFYGVYNELGGFLESVYEESLAIALREAGLSIERQVPAPVWFHGQNVGQFRADILVSASVLLELKSAQDLEWAHEAQLPHYLRSTEIENGLLLNFGSRPQFRRLLFDNEREKIRVNPCKSVARISA
jgi:GxxExxY protein